MLRAEEGREDLIECWMVNLGKYVCTSATQTHTLQIFICHGSEFVSNCIIESVDSISRDERDVPLTQYITNA